MSSSPSGIDSLPKPTLSGSLGRNLAIAASLLFIVSLVALVPTVIEAKDLETRTEAMGRQLEAAREEVRELEARRKTAEAESQGAEQALATRRGCTCKQRSARRRTASTSRTSVQTSRSWSIRRTADQTSVSVRTPSRERRRSAETHSTGVQAHVTTPGSSSRSRIAAAVDVCEQWRVGLSPCDLDITSSRHHQSGHANHADPRRRCLSRCKVLGAGSVDVHRCSDLGAGPEGHGSASANDDAG